jgi:hypothetical protein
MLVVPVGMMFQFCPESVVFRMVPLSPEMYPVEGFGKQTLYRLWEVMPPKLIHDIPPSVVLRMVPFIPEAYPSEDEVKKTDLKFSVVPLGSETQVAPPVEGLSILPLSPAA